MVRYFRRFIMTTHFIYGWYSDESRSQIPPIFSLQKHIMSRFHPCIYSLHVNKSVNAYGATTQVEGCTANGASNVV